MSENPLTDHDLELSPDAVKRHLDEGTAQIIDVREPYEWEAGHMPGVRHVELERLASSAPSVDQNKPVVFVCRAGVRSMMAAQAFRASGYRAMSMAGGMEAWHTAGLPLDPTNGHVAPH